MMGLPDCEGCAAGSNNWVVAGSHTASGKPLLSNDMHLNLTVPNIWFMADLEAPGFHAAGVTLPGMPFVIAGHNEHVAWGFTALMGDVQDLYIEKLDGKGNYQDVDGSWKPLAQDREIIKVRGGKDVLLDVQSTAHGPLLNPTFAERETADRAEVDALRSGAGFSSALPDRYGGKLDGFFSGTRGMELANTECGLRRRPWTHCLPRHGQDSAAAGGTCRPYPFADSDATSGGATSRLRQCPMPSIRLRGFWPRPTRSVSWEKFPYPLTLEWVDPYRVERIYKSLDGRDRLTPKDMLAVQTDIYSEMDQEMGQRLAYAIDHTDGVDERLRQAADLMRSWDGRLTTDSAAASIVTQARKALWPLILEPKLGKDADSTIAGWSRTLPRKRL